MARQLAQAPTNLAAANWSQRIQSLSDAGVSNKRIKQTIIPIANQDLRQVQSGSQAMPEDAAILAGQAALTGTPPLQKAPKSSWSPTDLLGDVTNDITNLTTGIIPGLAKFTWNVIPNTEKTAEMLYHGGTSKADQKWQKAHGYEPTPDWSLSSFAKGLRDVAKSPLLSAIPGVHTAAGLTTDPGREELLHHPISTSLDVLPIAQEFSRAAGLADLAEPGTAAEAALQAKPLKTAYRGLLPEAARASIGEAATGALRKVGLAPESFPISRQLDVESRKATQDFNKIAGFDADAVIKRVSEMPDAERTLLWNEAKFPDQYPNPSPEHAQILGNMDTMNELLYNEKAAPIDEATGRQTGEPGTLYKVSREEPIEPTPLTDVTGTPNANLGFAGDVPRTTGLPEMTDAERAAEQATIDEYHQNAEPSMVRESERRGAERRTTPETQVPGGQRAIDQLEPQDFEEARLVDEAHGDRRVLAERRTAMENASPAERRAMREAEQARFRQPAPGTEAERETAAQAAEAAGNHELAAAYRGEDVSAHYPGPRTAEEQAAFEKTLATDTRAPGTEPVPEKPRLYSYEEAAGVKPEDVTGTHTVEYVYPAESEVASAHRALGEAEDAHAATVQKAAQKLQAETILEQQRRLKDIDVHSGRVTRAEAWMESARQEVARAEESARTGRGKARTLDNAYTRLEKAHANLETRRAAAAEASDRLNNLDSRGMRNAKKMVEDSRANVEAKNTAFDEKFKNSVPASMQSIMDEKLRQAIADQAPSPEVVNAAADAVVRTQNVEGGTALALKETSLAGLPNQISPEEYAALHRDVMSSWQDVADAGFHPKWTHNVDVEEAGKVPSMRPLGLRNVRISQVKEVVGDLTPHVQDVAVSMSHALRELLRERGTNAVQDTWLRPRQETWSTISDEVQRKAEAMRAKGQIPRGVDQDGALQLALNKDYVEWNPDAPWATNKSRLTATAVIGDTKTYIPRYLAEIMDKATEPASPNAILKASTAATKVYKTSVMAFSLKHMAHIGFGGMMFIAGRGGIDELFAIPDAYRMVKDGTMPIELQRHLDIETPDQNFQVAAGNKLGELYMNGPGRVAKKITQVEETVTNMQRSISYLGEERRALRAGMSAEDAKAAGLAHAQKALVDLEGMNPLERNVLRQVLPFYAFMRHTLRYILTYPIDHPVRASMLTSISNMEQKDFSSGLPQQFQSLFFLGSPDKNGNITGIEMKQFNPFRDTGSYFTLSGFLKSLNPALQLPFAATGVDKFTGSPNLWQDLSYDPRTGNLVTKRPPNTLWNAAQSFVPELGTIDHFVGLTNDLRQLKASNPEAYKNQLWNSLFLPFEPKTINKAQEAADIQRNMLKIAQQDVSAATKTGSAKTLQGYSEVPYQGELVDPRVLASILAQIKKKNPNVAPRSVLPSVKLSEITG